MSIIGLVSELESESERGVRTLVPGESCQVFMRPRVRRNLMTVAVSIFDPVDRIGVVNAVI